MAMPGNTANQAVTSIYFRPIWSIPPHVATSGGTPTPKKLSEASTTMAVFRAEVMAEAEVGTRDLFLGDVFLPNAVTVYDRVDRIEVTPVTGMARVGGVVFPKRYEQFEARGYHHGADGVSGTMDDLDLGLVDVEWTLEEYATFVGDDDTEFVGVLDSEGFFTPAVDGPNSERLNNNNTKNKRKPRTTKPRRPRKKKVVE